MPDRGEAPDRGDVPIRPGDPSDAPFITASARLASVIEGRPLPPAEDPDVQRMLPGATDVSLVALDEDGRPVGAIWWHFPDTPLVGTPDGAPVRELVVAVTPEHRGRGIGRRLLDALAARAAEHGYDRLALNVHLRNPAARLYSRAGFVVAGKGRGPLGVARVRQSGVDLAVDGCGRAAEVRGRDRALRPRTFLPVCLVAARGRARVRPSRVQARERGPPVRSPRGPAREGCRRRGW